MRALLVKLICGCALLSSVSTNAYDVSRSGFSSVGLSNTTAAAEAKDRARYERKKRDEGRCVNDLDCAGWCVQGRCSASPPRSSIDASMQRRATEVYLRDRGVQLRQDLALGEGPVVTALAATLGVSATKLGKLMRSHRELLAATLGGANWPTRFLDQLETLSSPVSDECLAQLGRTP
jgi:hypothetical protein